MNDLQYANLVLELSALGQRSDVFDGLDEAEMRNLVFLLALAHDAAAAKAGLPDTQQMIGALAAADHLAAAVEAHHSASRTDKEKQEEVTEVDLPF